MDQDLAAQQPLAPAIMKVPQLKEQLKTFNMPVSGKKADLVHRLETALAAAAASGHASDAASPVDNPASAVSQEAEPAAASPSGHAALPPAMSDSAERQGAGSSPEALSPTHTVGSHATVSQQSMTSLEVAALNDDDEEEREPGLAGGRDGEAEVQQPVAGVQPGTEGLGDVATFEVRACSRRVSDVANFSHIRMCWHTHMLCTCESKPYRCSQP